MKGQSYLYFGTTVYPREVQGTALEMESDPSNTDVVKGPNHPPVANALSVTVAEDTATAIRLTGSDIDGDELTFVASSPAHRSLSGSAPNLTYTPAANYNGCIQVRRIQAFPAQQRADFARVRTRVSFLQDAVLILSAEPPPVRCHHDFRVGSIQVSLTIALMLIHLGVRHAG